MTKSVARVLAGENAGLVFRQDYQVWYRGLFSPSVQAGLFPWTIVRNTRRREYLTALDAVSADQNIRPFAEFIREEMGVDWSNEPSRK